MTPEQLVVLSLAKDYTSALENCEQFVVDKCERRLLSYVDQLLAQARADGMETAAKICDERAEWLRSNGHTLKAEQSETLAAAIRARKDA